MRESLAASLWSAAGDALGFFANWVRALALLLTTGEDNSLTMAKRLQKGNPLPHPITPGTGLILMPAVTVS